MDFTWILKNTILCPEFNCNIVKIFYVLLFFIKIFYLFYSNQNFKILRVFESHIFEILRGTITLNCHVVFLRGIIMR